MKISIDFYSKTEAAIRYDLVDVPPEVSQFEAKLRLLTWYVLRQTINVGASRPETKAACLILDRIGPDEVVRLAEGGFVFPDALELYRWALSEGLDFGWVHVPDIVGIVFLPGASCVAYRGPGKWRFAVDTSNRLVEAKGFGLIGYQIPYFLVQSVFCAISTLAAAHRADADCHRLSRVCRLISRAILRSGQVRVGGDIGGLTDDILLLSEQ
jgi:hypothetical protein